MGKKDDRMGNKTGYKKELKAKGKQRARKKDRTKKTLGKRASPPSHIKTVQI